MRKSCFLIHIIAVVVVLAFVALHAAAQSQLSPDVTAKIDKIATDTLAGTGVPSASIAIVKDGQIVFIKAYGDARLSFLCGRDAAERIANWDYGDPGVFQGMLRQFDLLVAARCGEYRPPAHQRDSFTILELPCRLDHVSASEIRARIARGVAWEHLVPPAAQLRVRQIYT